MLLGFWGDSLTYVVCAVCMRYYQLLGKYLGEIVLIRYISSSSSIPNIAETQLTYCLSFSYMVLMSSP